MRCLQNQMLRIRQHGFLILCRSSPEHADNRSVLGIYRLDNRIRKLFPAFALMRIGLVRSDSKYRVEQKNTLIRPFFQISVIRNIAAKVIMQFKDPFNE